MEQGRKLRSMYRELGHDRTSAAKFFRITPRTLFNWEAGRTAIPFAVFKLLRLMLRSELPGKDWDGWCFNQGTLWSPEFVLSLARRYPEGHAVRTDRALGRRRLAVRADGRRGLERVRAGAG